MTVDKNSGHKIRVHLNLEISEIFDFEFYFYRHVFLLRINFYFWEKSQIQAY